MRIAQSLPDFTCKGLGDSGTDESGTKGSMRGVCTGTGAMIPAEIEGVNRVLRVRMSHEKPTMVNMTTI